MLALVPEGVNFSREICETIIKIILARRKLHESRLQRSQLLLHRSLVLRFCGYGCLVSWAGNDKYLQQAPDLSARSKRRD